MEPARDLLSRAVPQLMFSGGTHEPSISDELLCASYMHLWPNFPRDVQNACNQLDLSPQVSHTDPVEGERFLVGSELGLTGRFTQNICEAVSKALSVTPLNTLHFGDVHTVAPSSIVIPDVVLAISNQDGTNQGKKQLVAVGELKTWWTVFLEDIPVTLPLESRRGLQRHIADYRFELSLPIDQHARNPSLRECFVAFSVIAAREPSYVEDEGIQVALLRSSISPSFQASIRPSLYRAHFQPSPPTATTQTPGTTASLLALAPFNITPDAILFGGDNVAWSSVRCLRKISGPKLRKAVFEVEYQGMECIAKCWLPEQFDNYASEAYVYENLHGKRQAGFDFFARLVFFGQIISSSVFPSGYILLIKKVDGERLSDCWDGLDSQDKSLVRDKCSQAVEILRSIGIWLGDPRKHNVLFSKDTKQVTMVDFEAIGECVTERDFRTLEPEMSSIFGFAVTREPMVGG